LVLLSLIPVAYWILLIYFYYVRRQAELVDKKSHVGFQSLPPVDYLADENCDDGSILQALLFEVSIHFRRKLVVTDLAKSLALKSGLS